MRRIAVLASFLLLSGCAGMDHFLGDTFGSSSNPNAPTGESLNMQRVRGQEASITPIRPETGNVWPGPLQPTPTLMDLESNPSALPDLAPQSSPEAQPRPAGRPGSSTPPGTVPSVPPASVPSANATPTAPGMPAPRPGGVVNTPGGPGVVTGGTSGYQTMTAPGGGQAIMVPNGNGTSTVIYPDGKVETVPTPK